MTDPAPRSFSPWTALKNGLRRMCPHCGEGQMLDGWLSTRRSCPHCGLVYQRKPGDTWAFWVIGDRIPVFIAVAAVYFSFGPPSRALAIMMFGSLVGLLIATTPHRVGVVVALHYLSRRFWPDPDDPIEPLKHP